MAFINSIYLFRIKALCHKAFIRLYAVTLPNWHTKNATSIRKNPIYSRVIFRNHSSMVYDFSRIYHKSKIGQLCNCSGCCDCLVLYQKLIDIKTNIRKNKNQIQSIQYPAN